MSEPVIDLRLWRQFVAVAEALHFGRAALSLHMTQPPLTQGIAQLERLLGVRLFDRTKRSVQMTAAGVVLLPAARDLLARARALPAQARAAQAGELGHLRLGFVSTIGFAQLPQWVRGFRARYPKVALELIEATGDVQLQALERGEIDAALCNAPEAEKRLFAQGLVHDRQPIAQGDFVIVGPAPRGKVPDPAGLAGRRDVAAALARLRDVALGAPGTLRFLSANDGSGTHAAEQALWRAAGVVPQAPWYAMADPKQSLAAQARAQSSYALVERGAWLAQGGAPLAVLVEGDARMAERVHVMRSFRVNHPAGKMFVAWIAGSRGWRVVAAQRGYRPLAA